MLIARSRADGVGERSKTVLLIPMFHSIRHINWLCILYQLFVIFKQIGHNKITPGARARLKQCTSCRCLSLWTNMDLFPNIFFPVTASSVRSFSEMSWKLGCNPQGRWAVSALTRDTSTMICKFLAMSSSSNGVRWNTDRLHLKWHNSPQHNICMHCTFLSCVTGFLSQKYHSFLCQITCFLQNQN